MKSGIARVSWSGQAVRSEEVNLLACGGDGPGERQRLQQPPIVGHHEQRAVVAPIETTAESRMARRES